MAKRTSYEPGTFSYTELHTTDPEAAKAFYGGVFGWKPEDVPIPDEAGGGTYTLLKLNGDIAAALFPQSQEDQDMGIPPSWLSYVTVAEADATAARAKEAGGTVLAEPFDVMEDGRMAVIDDPTGASFAVWEPRSSIGATRVNDPGCLTVNELSTNDVPKATEFYEALFGWKVEELDTQGGPRYWSIRHDGAAGGLNGGMRELPIEHQQEGVPSNWMPYFTVTSANEAIATAKHGGGAALAGPIDIPSGRFAVLHDPQGAFFAIFEGDVDD